MTSTRTEVMVPRAFLFDLATRTILYDANGYARSMHPVDQEVRIRVGVRKGALASDPATGLDVERILTARPDTRQRVAEDTVNVTLAAPIARGDVKVGRVVVDSTPGRVSLVVQYTNLRTGRAAQASAGA